MAKTWILIKTMLKMQFSTAGKSDMEKVSFGCLFIMVIPFGFFILTMLNSLIGSLYASLSPTENENVILGLLFVSVTIIYIFVTLSTVLSSFYFAEDVESFISLPFQPYQIVMGKAAVPFLSLYGINTILLLPSLLFYGIHSQSTIVYYAFALILWALTPVIPFALTAILVIFIMRFANISKNKDRTKMFMGMLGFLFIIGINIFIRLDSNQNGTGMEEIITEQNGLLDLVTKFFPTAYFSSISLTSPSSLTGVMYLLLVIALTVGGIILFMTVGQQWYFKGVLGLSGGKRSTFKDNQLSKRTRKQPVLKSLFLKEMRTILRTPTFFTQILVQSLFFPVFLVVILLLESSGSLSSLAAGIEGWSAHTTLIVLIAFTILGLGVNPAASSSISRDGKTWFNHLYLPIAARDVINSKLLISFFLNLLSITVISVVILFVLQVSILVWAIWLLASLAISWITSMIGLILDLEQPKLNWTDEREVFKGRMIGLFALAIEALVFAAMLLLLWLVPVFQNLVFSSLFMAFYLGLTLSIGQWYLNKKVKEKYTTLQA
ncbi:ABC transporter permease [Halobacillus litoralis]|uniref:putative ABC transporter permease subunit n=1 Tax=Halobacillus litoralis TaxID=45668 RepID=UPI001CD339F6|nr:ABC transporter permease [Halobacillus litoralis]MCA0969716.1 ABC transporter permease [Halobacillus litoralis]